MIIRSLRTRLLLVVGTIVVVMLAAVGVFSSYTVKREFDRFLVKQASDRGFSAVGLLEEHYTRVGSWKGVEPLLARMYKEHFRRTILADARGRVIAVYPPQLREYAIRIDPNGDLTMSRESPRERMKLRGGAMPIRGSGATVFLLPGDEARFALQRSFRFSLDRWLIVGLVGAAFAALGVTLMMLRRVFAPVDALTKGARALASGRLDARVPVGGDDEVGELARAFNAMAEGLERNERARRNMVSDVAHELRTPLTNIRVQLEAVQDGVVEPDAKLFASLEEDAATLARLVDDLQQLSLAEAGQLRLELAEVNVSALLDVAAGALARREKEVRIDAPQDLVIRGDARRLVQVLRNLIVNAVAHARSVIEVSAAREGDRVVIRVADDGPGIPAEHLDRIFDRFYRVDASRSRTTGGAGLGLAIARELVELHGGTIHAANRLEGGAMLTVSLPFISS